MSKKKKMGSFISTKFQFRDLDDENEDELVHNMELHQLYDMVENVSHSSKIKRAEFNLARREAEKSL